MTAYIGLLEIGKPAAGETVVVAAASGAVGSVVGQIARIKGAHAVGIAGGPDKCRYIGRGTRLRCLHRSPAPDFTTRLAAVCPKGVDVYFENVGGAISRPCSHYSIRSPAFRCAELISMYNATSLSPGPILLPAIDASDLDQAVDVSRFHRLRLYRALWGFHARCLRLGRRRTDKICAKTSLRGSRTHREPLLGYCEARILGNCWCAFRRMV